MTVVPADVIDGKVGDPVLGVEVLREAVTRVHAVGGRLANPRAVIVRGTRIR
ncbi:MAG TPA: hypothetical protein VFG35_28460 [Actinoplanes sp.]|nr:hypothetical protein [Actinoplanes sp.]